LNSDRKYRMTHQRKVILEEVMADHGHRSADEIYERVRRKLPRVSMGTVYRNLDILASCGFIKKLEPHYSQMRFDANTSEHYHVVCMRCGKIDDASIEPADGTLESLEHALGNLTRYGIFGHKLEFMGLCPDCMQYKNEFSENEEILLVKEGSTRED